MRRRRYSHENNVLRKIFVMWDTVVDYILAGIFFFFVGSTVGWCIEVLFRRFFSAKRWINPGFLTGPCLPLYGFGTVGLFALSFLPIHTGHEWLDALLIIVIMGVVMTLIEYIAGLIFIKGMKIRLWDYSKQWGNIQGLICPLFSLLWLVVAAAFYFLMTDNLVAMLLWFVDNIEFSYVVGIASGIFIIDFAHSMHLSAKIRKFAQEHEIVVHYEKLKETISDKVKEFEDKHPKFMFPFEYMEQLKEHLKQNKEKFSAKTRGKKAAKQSRKGK